MGMIGATLNGVRCTSARVTLSAWGRWYADAHLDGEHALTGKVTLQIADLTLVGTVLSGGASLGRSSYRIVAGAGGWGKAVAAKSYADDAGPKVATIVGDAAREVGESMADVSPSLRMAANFARSDGPASLVLEQVAPRGWYVDEAGVTHLGARKGGPIVGKTSEVSPIDKARQRVTIAAESIASVLPGCVYQSITAVDVVHEVSAEGGLRSTLWGSESAADALSSVSAVLDPHRRYRGLSEYRVDTQSGTRWNLQPVRASSGMPYLQLVPVRPGVAGCNATFALGSLVLVGFVDSDPDRPFIAHADDVDSERFAPSKLSIHSGGMSPTEHLMTAESTALLIYNTLVALMSAAGGGPLLAVVLQPLIGAAINTAIAAQSAPAPPGQVAQEALAATLLAGFATGLVPSNTSAFFNPAIAAAAAIKTDNVSGKFPSLGAAKVHSG